MATKKRRGGPPTKAPGGLTEVLFIRADQKLVAELEKLRLARMADLPGLTLSIADVARSILWEAVLKETKKGGGRR